jgi:hypothetical protein
LTNWKHFGKNSGGLGAAGCVALKYIRRVLSPGILIPNGSQPAQGEFSLRHGGESPGKCGYSQGKQLRAVPEQLYGINPHFSCWTGVSPPDAPYILVKTLPVAAGLHPEKNVQALKEGIDRGYVHIKFTETKGGMVLGVRLDTAAYDFSQADFETKPVQHIWRAAFEGRGPVGCYPTHSWIGSQ